MNVLESQGRILVTNTRWRQTKQSAGGEGDCWNMQEGFFYHLKVLFPPSKSGELIPQSSLGIKGKTQSWQDQSQLPVPKLSLIYIVQNCFASVSKLFPFFLMHKKWMEKQIKRHVSFWGVRRRKKRKQSEFVTWRGIWERQGW